MKKAIIITTLFLIFLFTNTRILAQEVNWTILESPDSWDSIKKVAKRLKKPVLLDMYSKECHYCKKLDTTALRNPYVTSFYNSEFVCTRVEISSDLGAGLVDRFELQTLPALIMTDDKGRQIWRIASVQPDSDYVTEFSSYVEDYKKYLVLKDLYYKASRTEQTMVDYAIILSRLNLKEEGKRVANAYFSLSDSFENSRPIWEIIRTYSFGYKNPQLEWVMNNKPVFESKYGREEVKDYLVKAFNEVYNDAISYRDTSKLSYALSIAAVVGFNDSNSTGTAQMLDYYRINYYEQILDWSNYARKVIDYNANYQVSDEDLRDFIINFYMYVSEPVFLEIASNLAKNLLQKEKTFENYFTMACISSKTASIKTARKYLKKAEELSTTEEQKKAIQWLDSQLVKNEK